MGSPAFLSCLKSQVHIEVLFSRKLRNHCLHLLSARKSVLPLLVCHLLASLVLFLCWSPQAANPGPRVQGKWSLTSDCHRAFIVWGPAGQPWGKNKMRVCCDLAVNSCPSGSCASRRGRQFSQSFGDLCRAEAGPS